MLQDQCALHIFNLNNTVIGIQRCKSNPKENTKLNPSPWQCIKQCQKTIQILHTKADFIDIP